MTYFIYIMFILQITAISGPKLVDFKKILHSDDVIQTKIKALKDEVSQYSQKFPLPGYPEY